MFYAPQANRGYRPPMLGGLGALGDIPIAAWQGGTQITYEKDGVIPNAFSTYKDSNVQAAFAASGLFVPTTVVFTAFPNFLGLTYKIRLSGVLPVTVNQSDVAKVIEGLLKNFYASGGTPVYSPAPNATQSVNSSTGAVASSNADTQVAPASQYGVLSAGSYADGSTYVALSDGSVLSFDNQGNPVSEDFGISGVSFAIAYDDGTTGVVMTDGTELLFNSQGYEITPGSTSNGAIRTVQTVNTNPGGTPPKKSGFDEFLDSLGLGKVPLSIGVGSGVVVAGLAIAAYFVATSGKR